MFFASHSAECFTCITKKLTWELLLSVNWVSHPVLHSLLSPGEEGNLNSTSRRRLGRCKVSDKEVKSPCEDNIIAKWCVL